MNLLDWAVLIATQIFIVVYGLQKSKDTKNIHSYLLGDKGMSWFTIGLSIMATQASAITFLSTPGQAYGDGMRFVQFYMGMPIAMIILSATIVPVFHRLNVYTAYEYLETRFDLKTRSLGAFLFLSQRSFGAGLSIYAPSLILSTVLGWDMLLTNLIIGLIVVFYTVTGGSKAVNYTQKQQMLIILIGMFIAGWLLVWYLPQDISFVDAIKIAGKMERLNSITYVSLDWNEPVNVWNDRYNLFTGLLAGTFLFLSYFGTDQSQVQRYLGGKSVAESRLGLIMNGIVKVPMQFLILFVGILLFVFYQFTPSPLIFNRLENEKGYKIENVQAYQQLEKNHQENQAKKQIAIRELLSVMETGTPDAITQKQKEIQAFQSQETNLRRQAISLVRGNTLDATLSKSEEKAIRTAETKDRDYVFISFITQYIPHGLVGLLIAVILAAAMSSASSELNALAATSLVDIYKRMMRKDGSDEHYLIASKVITAIWGCFAIGFALFAGRLENLIQAVNILGSLVYGTVLGIFIVAFYIKKINGTQVFWAAVVAELLVIGVYVYSDISFLWYNFIGCWVVVFFSWIFSFFIKKEENKML